MESNAGSVTLAQTRIAETRSSCSLNPNTRKYALQKRHPAIGNCSVLEVSRSVNAIKSSKRFKRNPSPPSVRSGLGLCPRDWSTRYCTYRRERPSLLDLLSELGLISDGWLGSISPLEIGPMHSSVEGLRPWDWSYPVLPYLWEWPTPTVIIFDMSTVAKPQQPPSLYHRSINNFRQSLESWVMKLVKLATKRRRDGRKGRFTQSAYLINKRCWRDVDPT